VNDSYVARNPTSRGDWVGKGGGLGGLKTLPFLFSLSMLDVGAVVGVKVRACVGAKVGACVGAEVGAGVGAKVGASVGAKSEQV